MALLDVKELSVHFGDKNTPFKAVDRISYQVAQGEVLGIVGESGSGKSVSSLAIMGLIDHPGRVSAESLQFENTDLLTLESKAKRQLIGADVAMIFQDPMTSLDPTMKVGMQVAESMIKHLKLSKKEALQQAVQLLEQVGIPNAEKRVNDYPHQFSGGQRQRIVIAIALACNPDILIADEPTTALDVTIQAQILELLKEIQQKQGTSIIFITHDLGVVANVADRVAVMYAGKIVEYGLVDEIFYNPRHPYTWGLLCSMPSLEEEGSLYTIPGTPPDLLNPPKGDAFALRSDYALDIDFEEMPPMFAVSNTHAAATWLLDERAPKVEPPEEIQKRWAQFESRRVTNE